MTLVQQFSDLVAHILQSWRQPSAEQRTSSASVRESGTPFHTHAIHEASPQQGNTDLDENGPHQLETGASSSTSVEQNNQESGSKSVSSGSSQNTRIKHGVFRASGNNNGIIPAIMEKPIPQEESPDEPNDIDVEDTQDNETDEVSETESHVNGDKETGRSSDNGQPGTSSHHIDPEEHQSNKDMEAIALGHDDRAHKYGDFGSTQNTGQQTPQDTAELQGISGIQSEEQVELPADHEPVSDGTKDAMDKSDKSSSHMETDEHDQRDEGKPKDSQNGFETETDAAQPDVVSGEPESAANAKSSTPLSDATKDSDVSQAEEDKPALSFSAENPQYVQQSGPSQEVSGSQNADSQLDASTLLDENEYDKYDPELKAFSDTNNHETVQSTIKVSSSDAISVSGKPEIVSVDQHVQHSPTKEFNGVMDPNQSGKHLEHIPPTTSDPLDEVEPVQSGGISDSPNAPLELDGNDKTSPNPGNPHDPNPSPLGSIPTASEPNDPKPAAKPSKPYHSHEPQNNQDPQHNNKLDGNSIMIISGAILSIFIILFILRVCNIFHIHRVFKIYLFNNIYNNINRLYPKNV